MQIRDIVLRQQARFETKTDKQIFRRAVLTTEGGLQTSSDPPNDVWASRNERRVWYMADGATQPAQILCRKISNPYVGLGVIIGYADGSNAKEVLTTDFFLTGAGTNLDGWDDTGPEDLEPGGNKLLWVYTKVITPLATYPDPTGLAVNIIAGDYPYAGARKSFAGSLSLALTQNPNPGEHYYAGLYLDSSNTLQVIYGASVSTALTAPEPSWPAGAFELSVVLIDDVQTSIDFDTDIFDRRMAWSDEFAGGGWPFAKVLTVSATDPDADYPTITAAIAASGLYDTIVVDTGNNSEGSLALGQVVTLTSWDDVHTILLGDGSADSFALSVYADSAKVYNISVAGSGAGTESGSILVDGADNSVLRQASAVKSVGVPTTASGVKIQDATGVLIDNCTISATAGTNKYALYVAGSSSTSVTVAGGIINGTTADIRVNNSSATVTLLGPQLLGGGISVAAGTIRGFYYDSAGNLIFVNTSGMSGGVWRYRADNVRVKEADLSTAYTNASAGDEIHLFPGTYTINALAINKAIAIIGADPLTTIIEGTTNNSYPLKATADNVRLENLTIKQTGGGGGGTNGFGLYLGANGVIAKNCIIQATGATAANYAVYHDAGTTGNCKLINCDLTATGGSAGNYGYVQATVATLMEIWGGSITAATNEVYGSNASAKIWLFNPELKSGASYVWTGTIAGEAFDVYGRKLRIKPAGINGGRLTLTSATPILTGDVTAATTVYYTPFRQSELEVYNGYFWVEIPFLEISVAVPATVYRLFDIWAYDNAGTLALEVLSWNQSTAAITAASNATPIVITSNGHGLSNNDIVAIAGVGGNTAANGIWSVANIAANTFELEGSTGNAGYTSGGTWYKLNSGRATALALQDGRYVKSGTTTRLFLGTGMTTGTSGQTEFVQSTPSNVLLSNYYNRIKYVASVQDTTSNTYTSAATRIYRNIIANKLGFVVGVSEDTSNVAVDAEFNFDAGDGAIVTGTSINRTGAVATAAVRISDVGQFRYAVQFWLARPAAGYSFVQLVQQGAATSPDFLLAHSFIELFL